MRQFVPGLPSAGMNDAVALRPLMQFTGKNVLPALAGKNRNNLSVFILQEGLLRQIMWALLKVD